MEWQAASLLAAAERYRQDRPPRHAVILDLSGLLHIDEPVFRSLLRRWLLGDGKPGSDGAAVVLFEPGRERLILSVPESLLAERRKALARVASALATHHRGEIKAEWFDLSRQAGAFAETIRLLVEQLGQAQYPNAPPAADALDRFMEIERTLHSVDLSSLLREQVVYRMEDGAELVPVMVERTVSISMLDRLFGMRMREEPWLFDHVTALLDRRMLYDLLRDTAVHTLPVAVKLHAATVAGELFREMTARFPARLHGKLVVEMPFLEWVADPETFTRAMAVARADEIGIAIDHVPAMAPSDTELPSVDWYRIPWLGDDGMPADLSGGISWLGPVDRNRCILLRCRDDKALEDARTVGFRYVEGPAATRAYYEGVKTGEDGGRAAGVPRAGQAPVEGPAPAEKQVGGSWWSRLFGGGGSAD